MNREVAECCAGYQRARVSRRRFLQGAVASTGAIVASQAFGTAFRQVAMAATHENNVLVVLSLRGGIDGMGVVVPHGDPEYYRARPSIGVPADALLQADAMFGLHPNLKPLEWMFENGEFAAVHATGLPVPNRSHFAAIQAIEDADPMSPLRQGWVNRLVGLSADQSHTEAIHIGSSVAPILSAGPAPTLAIKNLGSVSLRGAEAGLESTWRMKRRNQLATAWDGVEGPLAGAVESAVRLTETWESIPPSAPARQQAYPATGAAGDLGRALADTAALIRSGLDLSVVTVDYGSWDMHNGYGNLKWGQMRSMVSGLADALNAFMADLGESRRRVTVVTVSEFGRQTRENANGGLDHGWGNAMLVLGSGIKGGYYGRWPGLQADAGNSDVSVTTDYRVVLGELIEKRLGLSAGQVLPGAPRDYLNLVRQGS